MSVPQPGKKHNVLNIPSQLARLLVNANTHAQVQLIVQHHLLGLGASPVARVVSIVAIAVGRSPDGTGAGRRQDAAAVIQRDVGAREREVMVRTVPTGGFEIACRSGQDAGDGKESQDKRVHFG